MAINEGLYQLLAGEPTVNALLGDATGTRSLFLSVAAKNFIVPFIVFHRISSVPLVDLEATNQLKEVYFQFDCIADTAAKARNLANAVRNFLQDYSGTLADGTVVQGAVLKNDLDMPYEQAGLGYIFRSVIDVTLFFIES